MLTGETALLTSLEAIYNVYTRMPQCNNHVHRIFCGPSYAHRDVWEKLVHLFAGTCIYRL